MAAQKLTRGRFVQIIIMLSLLVTAFIWRTIDHSSMIDLNCTSDEECTFYVNNVRFHVNIEGDKIYVIGSESGWEIKEVSNAQIRKNDSKAWLFNSVDKLQPLTFKLEKKSENIQEQIRIRSR